jgi:hypothetical protein
VGVSTSGDVGGWWAGLQLREANSTHTPDYDEPDETAQRKIYAQRDLVRLGIEGRVATHARLFTWACRKWVVLARIGARRLRSLHVRRTRCGQCRRRLKHQERARNARNGFHVGDRDGSFVFSHPPVLACRCKPFLVAPAAPALRWIHYGMTKSKPNAVLCKMK